MALVPLLALGSSLHPGVVVRRMKDVRAVREVFALTRPAIAAQAPVAAMIDCLRSSAQHFLTAAA